MLILQVRILYRHFFSRSSLALLLFLCCACSPSPKGIDSALLRLTSLDDETLLTLMLPESYDSPILTDRSVQLYKAEQVQVQIARAMLDAGANVDVRNQRKETPLVLSTKQNRGYLVSLLIQKGARNHIKDSYDRSAYDYAQLHGDRDISGLLVLAEGLDQHNPPSLINHLIVAASKDGSPSAVSYLLDMGADPNFEYRGSPLSPTTRPLNEASFFGHEEVVRLLISRGADINATNSEGKPPLYMALDFLRRHPTESSALRNIELLLDHDALTDIAYRPMGPALRHAIQIGNREAVQLLLNHGADPTYVDGLGLTLLEQINAPDILPLLVNHGADINTKNRDGETLLMTAARNNDIDLVKTCIDLGADPNIVNGKGATALNIATSPIVIQLLKAAGAKHL